MVGFGKFFFFFLSVLLALGCFFLLENYLGFGSSFFFFFVVLVYSSSVLRASPAAKKLFGWRSGRTAFIEIS